MENKEALFLMMKLVTFELYDSCNKNYVLNEKAWIDIKDEIIDLLKSEKWLDDLEKMEGSYSLILKKAK